MSGRLVRRMAGWSVVVVVAVWSLVGCAGSDFSTSVEQRLLQVDGVDAVEASRYHPGVPSNNDYLVYVTLKEGLSLTDLDAMIRRIVIVTAVTLDGHVTDNAEVSIRPYDTQMRMSSLPVYDELQAISDPRLGGAFRVFGGPMSTIASEGLGDLSAASAMEGIDG